MPNSAAAQAGASRVEMQLRHRFAHGTVHDACGAALGRCRRISGGILDCRDLVPAVDDFPRGVPALADRNRHDCVVPVTMPRFIGGVENSSKDTPVS